MANSQVVEILQPRVVQAEDAALSALIDDALAFQIGLAMPALLRAEARIKASFVRLDVVAARALYQRLVQPATTDRLACRFLRLARGAQLLGFLRDARRVNARG